MLSKDRPNFSSPGLGFGVLLYCLALAFFFHFAVHWAHSVAAATGIIVPVSASSSSSWHIQRLSYTLLLSLSNWSYMKCSLVLSLLKSLFVFHSDVFQRHRMVGLEVAFFSGMVVCLLGLLFCVWDQRRVKPYRPSSGSAIRNEVHTVNNALKKFRCSSFYFFLLLFWELCFCVLVVGRTKRQTNCLELMKSMWMLC